jgi:tetratricopeptide (TPR) repeat protein
MKTQTFILTVAAVLAAGTAATAQTTAAEKAAAARQAAEAARDAAWTVRMTDVAEVAAAARQAVDTAREIAASDLVARAREVAAVAGEWRFEYQTDAAREAARAKEAAEREKERAQREKEREYSVYDQGQQALDSGRWDRAITSFDRVIELKSSKADAALYWKAYAQNKLGQRPEALATIGTLLKEHPKSRYLNDAKALEVDIKQSSGRPVNPADESDEEIKILALNALQHSAPEDAIPMLQKVLQGTGSPKLKARALFVLAQSNSPKAREVLVNIAKGNANPDLQMRAVTYLAIHGGRESRAALADIYASSTDIDMKKRILRAFMQGGEKDRLVTAAQSEQNPELRATAVQQLGNMSAHEELWSLYQKESTLDVKKQIIRSLFTGGSVTRLSELARGEQNPELRLLAVRNLGVMDSRRTGDVLVEIYNKDKDVEIRKAVISGLANSNNAEALVALARKESDMDMKKLMVSRLSNMANGSKVARDYLLEIIGK